MLIVLAVLALIVALATVPIMVGARMVHAERTEFGRALLVAIALGVLGMGIGKVVHNGLVAFLAQAAVGGWLISAFMGTTYLRGIAIGFIASVLQFVAIAMLAGAAFVAA
jgi:hypothetical protein